MTQRLLVVLTLALMPTLTLAQQSQSYPGECDHARACPEGQIMDSATKACTTVSS